MKKNNTEKNSDTSINTIESGIAPLNDYSIFTGGVTLSDSTLQIAHKLGVMDTSTLSGQVTYLKQTPEFARSVFMDTAISTLGSANIQNYGNINYNNNSPYPINSKITGNFYTTSSGTIPLNTNIVNSGNINIIGTESHKKINDISGIMATGIAVGGLTNMNSQIAQASGRLSTNLSAIPFDWTGASTGLSANTQSTFNTTALQGAYQTIGTSFTIAHTSDIQERAVMAIETLVIEQKRSTEETVKMREELSKSNKLKEEDLVESKKLRKTLEMMIKGQQKQLRILTPQLEVETIQDVWFDFNETTQTLSNSLGKTTTKISGQPLNLLKCFLENAEYKCSKITVIQKMKSEQKHTGARNQLKSLLRGVATIKSIPNRDNGQKVDFYRLEIEN